MDSLFLVACQSALVLGLIHGINPCGHSWLVLAPFVAGDTSGRRVALLTAGFIGGTTAGCLVIGTTLGTVSAALPDAIRPVMDVLTTAIVILLGIVLIWKPHLLHNHHHDHDNETHEHSHDDAAHGHCHACRTEHAHGHPLPLGARKSTVWGLTLLGFVNMIVPCPTVAIMYTYALESANTVQAATAFGSYALGTAIALAGVIFAIYMVTDIMRKLQKPWIEPAIMRTAGALTILFGAYTLYLDFAII